MRSYLDYILPHPSTVTPDVQNEIVEMYQKILVKGEEIVEQRYEKRFRLDVNQKAKTHRVRLRESTWTNPIMCDIPRLPS